MVMPLLNPEPLSPGPGQDRLTDVKDPSIRKTMSVADKMKERLKGKPPAEALPAGWNPITDFTAEEQVAQGTNSATSSGAKTGNVSDSRGQKSTPGQVINDESSSPRKMIGTEQGSRPSSQATRTADFLTTGGAGAVRTGADMKGKGKVVAGPDATAKDELSVPFGPNSTGDDTKAEPAPTGPNATKQEDRMTRVGALPTAAVEKTDLAAPDKSNGMFGGLFKKSQKSKDKDIGKEMQAAAASMAKLSAEATKAAEDLKRGNVPQIKVGDGFMSKEAKEEALKRYQDILASGRADPFTMAMAAGKFGALDAVREPRPARAHSISEDTVLIDKSGSSMKHSLSTDAVVSTGKAAPAHELAHDRVINAEPSRRGTHRLSEDAMIPVRAVASGHYLDEDPLISGTQQLFPHELLDDTRVLRSKSPQPHNLDVDRMLATSQKQAHAHDLHSDTVLAAPQVRSAHDLHSDLLVKSAGPARGEHDMAHDVRILSPSGAVRDPHSIGDDEIIKENAVFRKSPHPDAMMPGEWAVSSSSGASDANNTMASLNASLQTAGQALNELHQAMGVASPGKENTTGMSISIHPLRLRSPLVLKYLMACQRPTSF